MEADPLIGKVRLSKTRLEVRKIQLVDTQTAPLTPEQGVVYLQGWTQYSSEAQPVESEAQAAALIVAPLIVNDTVYGVIRIGDAEGASGFTILLDSAGFGIVADQFRRTDDIMKMEEGHAPPEAPSPPFGEGRASPRTAFDQGDRKDGKQGTDRRKGDGVRPP